MGIDREAIAAEVVDEVARLCGRAISYDTRALRGVLYKTGWVEVRNDPKAEALDVRVGLALGDAILEAMKSLGAGMYCVLYDTVEIAKWRGNCKARCEFSYLISPMPNGEK